MDSSDDANVHDFSRVSPSAGPKGDRDRSRSLLPLAVALCALGYAVVTGAAALRLQWPDFFTLSEVEAVLALAVWVCPVLGMLTTWLAADLRSTWLWRAAISINLVLVVVAVGFSLSLIG